MKLGVQVLTVSGQSSKQRSEAESTGFGSFGQLRRMAVDLDCTAMFLVIRSGDGPLNL